MSDTQKFFPRVLVVSHETFTANTSMGRTMATYFRGWDADSLAQFYIQSQIPTTGVCGNYYKYTDVDALASLLQRRKTGKILTSADVDEERTDATDTGNLGGVYYFGSQKRAVTYLLRDWMWKHSTWHSDHLMNWIREFDPQVIFFAAGDYIFSNDIACSLAEELDIPLVTCCMDDYYLYNKNAGTALGRARQEEFMRSVRRLLDRSSFIFTISELMAEEYSRNFGVECRVLYTGSSFVQPEDIPEKREGISYLGGLEYNRNLQLADIGRVLSENADGIIPDHVDVYSGSAQELASCFSEGGGVVFHGSVPASEVSRIIASSAAVIHTESFDEQNRQAVRFSVSTKIPDCLASGTPILAYGPRDVASVHYLQEHDAAFVAGSRDELKDCIFELFHDPDERAKKKKNAVLLAEKNHKSDAIAEYVRRNLAETVRTR